MTTCGPIPKASQSGDTPSALGEEFDDFDSGYNGSDSAAAERLLEEF